MGHCDTVWTWRICNPPRPCIPKDDGNITGPFSKNTKYLNLISELGGWKTRKQDDDLDFNISKNIPDLDGFVHLHHLK